jgi:hypothetical protein
MTATVTISMPFEIETLPVVLAEIENLPAVLAKTIGKVLVHGVAAFHDRNFRHEIPDIAAMSESWGPGTLRLDVIERRRHLA